MQVEDARAALSVVLRRVAPDIIRRVVIEAARSSGARDDDVRAYEALMNALAPMVLDVVARDDNERVRAFAQLATTDVEGMKPVPPVARVGLLEIGLGLAGLEAQAAARRGEVPQAVLDEFTVFAEQMRVALAELGRPGPRDRR